MPHDIQIRENYFLDFQDKKIQRFAIGKAENIAIDGQVVPETRVETRRAPPPPMPRLQEMEDDGILRWSTPQEKGERK